MEHFLGRNLVNRGYAPPRVCPTEIDHLSPARVYDCRDCGLVAVAVGGPHPPLGWRVDAGVTLCPRCSGGASR